MLHAVIVNSPYGIVTTLAIALRGTGLFRPKPMIPIGSLPHRWTGCLRVCRMTLAVTAMFASLQLPAGAQERDLPWNTRLFIARYR
jgi:hypothetical protein